MARTTSRIGERLESLMAACLGFASFCVIASVVAQVAGLA